jgi:anti-sigma regulatory factor (Ser/Thr protein kinase)
MEMRATRESDSDVIAVQQATDAAEARRLAMARAERLSFDESEAGKLALVVTEISKNLLKHAAGGDLFLRTMQSGSGVEVLALDKGPGIEDVGRCFEDGYSTAGTSGTGLGAVARLSDAHDVYSRRGQGTVLMAQVWKKNGAPRGARFCVGAVSRALPGETACGDGWLFQERPTGARLLLADGLGHGVHAAEAAQASIGIARERVSDVPTALLERVHAALRHTRGAAVAIADIDPAARVVRFAGIGNVSAILIPPSGRWVRMVSHSGTAGYEMRKAMKFTYPWASQSLLLMHSDGLGSNWSFDPYPGLPLRHPSLVAAVLYRDHSRGRDDVTVVAAREGAAREETEAG